MELSKKFLHDRLVLGMVTLISVLVVIGVSIVFLRFDAARSTTTIIAYRQNNFSYVPGKPIDIYSLAIFMILIAAAAVLLSARIYPIRRSLALFLLGSTIFLLILSAVVANAIILKQ